VPGTSGAGLVAPEVVMRFARVTAVLVATLSLLGCGKSKDPVAPPSSPTLASSLESARTRYRLPAMAGAVIEPDSLHVAVTGVRRADGGLPVLESDLFHAGSLTKGVLASAIGRLVEQGTLRWSLTLAEAFPEMGDSLHPDLRTVTLAQLLQHRAGLQPFVELEEFEALPPLAGDPPAQRRAFARWLIAQPPASAVGGFRYSNAGYGVAAAIAEHATGEDWVALVRTRVLDAIPVSTFAGWPLDSGPLEPWGHYEDAGALVPAAPSLGRVPDVVTPAGDLSFTIRDFARYAQLHLRSLLGRPQVLADSTFRRLHTPSGEYAMGWVPATLGGRSLLWHDGSAGTFYAFVMLDPGRQRAYALFTNAVTAGVDSAFAEVLDAQGLATAAAALAAIRQAEPARARPARGARH
jgi:CubicO group peptidase (beta-lactamase class C family)